MKQSKTRPRHTDNIKYLHIIVSLFKTSTQVYLLFYTSGAAPPFRQWDRPTKFAAFGANPHL